MLPPGLAMRTSSARTLSGSGKCSITSLQRTISQVVLEMGMCVAEPTIMDAFASGTHCFAVALGENGAAKVLDPLLSGNVVVAANRICRVVKPQLLVELSLVELAVDGLGCRSRRHADQDKRICPDP